MSAVSRGNPPFGSSRNLLMQTSCLMQRLNVTVNLKQEWEAEFISSLCSSPRPLSQTLVFAHISVSTKRQETADVLCRMYLCLSCTDSNGSGWDRFLNTASSAPTTPPPPTPTPPTHPQAVALINSAYTSPSTLLPGLTAFEVVWGNWLLRCCFLGWRRTDGPHLWFWATVHTVDNSTMCMTGTMGSDRWEHEPTEGSVIILSLAHFHSVSSNDASSLPLSLAHTFPLHVGQCLIFRNLICPG